MSKRALCATSIAVAGEGEEATDGGTDRRRPAQLDVAQPGQRGDRGLQPRAGVRERLEALGQLESLDPDGADLARSRGAGP